MLLSRETKGEIAKLIRENLRLIFGVNGIGACADDILITARTKQTMTDTFEKLKNISSQFCLIV
jgi:hypothetical protein